jgi:hypothetical protein
MLSPASYENILTRVLPKGCILNTSLIVLPLFHTLDPSIRFIIIQICGKAFSGEYSLPHFFLYGCTEQFAFNRRGVTLITRAFVDIKIVFRLMV